MSELERWIVFAVLAVFWLKFMAYNLFFEIHRIRRRRHDGPSAMMVFGSLFGIAALLAAPVATLPLRLLFVPLAVLPDLTPLIGDRIIERLGPREAPPER